MREEASLNTYSREREKWSARRAAGAEKSVVEYACVPHCSVGERERETPARACLDPKDANFTRTTKHDYELSHRETRDGCYTESMDTDVRTGSLIYALSNTAAEKRGMLRHVWFSRFGFVAHFRERDEMRN